MKKGNIEIFEKTEDGWRNNNDEIFKNIDDYVNINDKVEHQVGDLLGSIESAIERIDYKIENHQLSFFGANINSGFISELFFVLASLVIGIIQQVYE